MIEILIRTDTDHTGLFAGFLDALVLHVFGLEQEFVGSVVGAGDAAAGRQDHGKGKGCDKGEVLERFHG